MFKIGDIVKIKKIVHLHTADAADKALNDSLNRVGTIISTSGSPRIYSGTFWDIKMYDGEMYVVYNFITEELELSTQEELTVYEMAARLGL